jgi:TonB family protein
MELRSILGLAGAGIVGVAGFFGFDNADNIGNTYKDLTISAKSEEAAFLVGDWCGRSGERQRFERQGDGIAFFSCLPASGQVCGAAAFAHGGAGGGRNIDLGWANGHLTYRAKGDEADINVNQIDERRFQAYLATGLGFSEWTRCDGEEGLKPTAQPVINVQVDVYKPDRPLYVSSDSAVFRLAPVASDATPVARPAAINEVLDVRGRALQSDGYWYEVRLEGGAPAFIPASVTTDVMPEGMAAPEPAPAMSPEEIAAVLPALRITEEPRALAGEAGRPELTRTLRRAKAYGLVKMELCIAADGRVTQATMAASSGKPKLDAHVLEWLQTARFDPAKAGDEPVDFCGFRIDYTFAAD